MPPCVVMLVSCVVLAALTGCARMVHVVDPNGAPVEGAEVFAVAPSINSAPAMTDENGDACFPGLGLCLETIWAETISVSVGKPGFKGFGSKLSETTWPLHVTLVPEDADTSPQ